ncbi:hypothetical protein P7K49_020316 [Saguinus oedipus]|uniref:Secreted protein n=1 Tax=Saguinus oedipus TaxID=9490 RepID=A0ABQ9UZW3_SAGOE|nr:hypothetical protein P7K49_020316 [Saguinus oedipus]
MCRPFQQNFLSWAADILVGVGLGCLLQISRSHTDVKGTHKPQCVREIGPRAASWRSIPASLFWRTESRDSARKT